MGQPALWTTGGDVPPEREEVTQRGVAPPRHARWAPPLVREKQWGGDVSFEDSRGRSFKKDVSRPFVRSRRPKCVFSKSGV